MPNIKKVKPDMYILVGCLLAAIIAIYFLNAQITLYSDDFFYGTFFRDGLGEFVRNTIWHYNNFNGRVLVHALLQVALIFDTMLIPAVNIIFLLAICYFAYRLSAENFVIRDFLVYALFFFCTFMLIDVSFLRESFLWSSGTFNYTLGVVGICAALFIAKSNAHTVKWYIIPLSFFTGATTEQSGLTAFFGITVIFFAEFIKLLQEQKKICENVSEPGAVSTAARETFAAPNANVSHAASGSIFSRSFRFSEKSNAAMPSQWCILKNYLLVGIPCLLGVITIFLSPATHSRMVGEASPVLNNIIHTLYARFTGFSVLIYTRHHIVIFIMFGAAFGVAALCNNWFSKKLCFALIFLPLAFFVLRLPIFGGRFHVLYAVANLAFLCIAALIMLIHRTQENNLDASSDDCCAEKALNLEAIRVDDFPEGSIQKFSPDRIKQAAGVLVLTAVFSLFVMVFTSTIEPRVVFPLNLLLLAAIAVFVCEIAKKYRRLVFAAPFYLAVCFLILLPIINGYRENRKIMDANLASIADGGAVFFNIDFNDNFRHILMHECGFIYQNFRVYHNIGSYRSINLYSSYLAAVYAGENRLPTPVYYVDGEPSMSLQLVINGLGGTTLWTPETTFFYFNNMHFELDNRTSVIRRANDDGYYKLNIILRGAFNNITAAQFYEVFGISYAFDGTRYVMYLYCE